MYGMLRPGTKNQTADDIGQVASRARLSIHLPFPAQKCLLIKYYHTGTRTPSIHAANTVREQPVLLLPVQYRLRAATSRPRTSITSKSWELEATTG